jgi:Zn-dependent M28 family amino/carboxypeptidase
MLVNDPPVPDATAPSGLDPKTFGGRAMTYYGRWTYKYEIGAKKKAAAVLLVHETGPAGYPFAVVQVMGGEQFTFVTPGQNMDRVAIEGWITLDQAKGLLTRAGQDFDRLKARAATRAFTPVPLGLTASMTIRNTMRRIESQNVVARLEGGDPVGKAEHVIYTAHWDHLGIGEPDSTGDNIYNGAVDNGTGLGTLLELARAFGAADKRPTRSVIFLAVTAEESGLLGSEYYAANPLYSIGKTVANLNMDGPPPLGPVADFSIRGNAPQTLQDDLIAVGVRHGLAFVPDARPEAGRFYRSDHFNFAKVGVPAISLDAGSRLASGAEATPLLDAYVAERYHQPSDEYTPDWDLEGLVQNTLLLYDLGRQLADSNNWPTWKEGAEFKAERDKTTAERVD